MIVGAGRVGSSVARMALEAGHEVSVLDEDPLSHERLDANQQSSWEDAGGRFTVGTAPEMGALMEGGLAGAPALSAPANGVNTTPPIAPIPPQTSRSRRLILPRADPPS